VRIFWAAERFSGFGRDPFAPSRRVPISTTVSGRRKSELKAALRAECPNAPGVYGMLDATGRLIYVGKSKSLRTRLLSYFSPRVAHDKPGQILRETKRLVWEQQPNEFAALLRELYLIRTWRPRWNVKDQPKSRRPSYVALGRGPARQLFVTTDPPKGALVYGPFHARGRLIEAVEALNAHYRLRDCSSSQSFHFSDQQELFPTPRRAGCLRFELGTCLGPCVAACSRQQYSAYVRKAKSFLDGHDDSPITVLRTRMAHAAAEQRFETAARLRDRLDAVAWLAARLESLRTARETFNFVYPVSSTNGRDIWYCIAAGCVATAVHAPTDRRRGGPALRLLEQWNDTGRLDGFPIVEQHPTITLLSHWFRTRPEELERTLPREAALAICRNQAQMAT
jgi:excinuclease ABC subunit C